jgi:hypothetical protein
VVTVEDTIQVSFLRRMNDRSHFGPFWPDLSAARTTTSAWMQTRGGARVSRQNSPQRKGPHQRCGKTQGMQGNCSQALAAVDNARLHDERDALEHADVFQWVTRDGNDVGVVARLEHPDLVLPVE